ncbi:MAG: sigma-70 family RNA polymerase sigma factor, partial [Vampirovibrionales bacterium]|nr:sigma-70 family RNA polymerase sigma factor [Vampirovibrionales bacterium]
MPTLTSEGSAFAEAMQTDSVKKSRARAKHTAAQGQSHPAMVAEPSQKPEKLPLGKSKDLKDYVELIETVARVEYSRLPNHLIDYAELVNIGALALHTLFKANPTRDYNVTYLSTAMKWAVRNELRFRYKWYALKTPEGGLKNTDTDVDGEESFDEEGSAISSRSAMSGAAYESILSMESMMEGDTPHELRDDSATPEESSETREIALLVRECMAKLPEREKMIIEARFFKNMKMREIGTRFDISPSRTSRIVQSGLDKIKAELLRRGYA